MGNLNEIKSSEASKFVQEMLDNIEAILVVVATVSH
jgi:riboflavin biosynthesis pyrimidine reductase